MAHVIDQRTMPVPTYWIAYGDDNTRHVGVTMPGQITDTGQLHILKAASASALIGLSTAVNFANWYDLPQIGEVVNAQPYSYENKLVWCSAEHVRTYEDPKDASEYYY